MIRRIAVSLLAAGLLTACGEPATPTDNSATSPSQAPSQAPSQTPSQAPSQAPSEAPKMHRLELEVTGTATPSVRFTLDGKVSTQKAVKLPWRKSVDVAYGTGTHKFELVMKHTGGELSAVATVDGALVTRTGGSGSPGSNNTSTLSGSFAD